MTHLRLTSQKFHQWRRQLQIAIQHPRDWRLPSFHFVRLEAEKLSLFLQERSAWLLMHARQHVQQLGHPFWLFVQAHLVLVSGLLQRIRQQGDRLEERRPEQLELVGQFELYRMTMSDLWHRVGGERLGQLDRSLVLVTLLAALLRLFHLAGVPNGLFCDEAIEGYDAFSLGNTLRDHNGDFLPFFLKGFGNDYREPLYDLLAIPFIKLLGLSVFTTRLPAALIGTATVLVLYYLVKECRDRQTGLIAALLLSISPWHMHFSRVAFRAILLPFGFCLSLLFFLKSFKKPTYLVHSAVCFAFTTYTYSSARGFVPLYMLAIAVVFCRHLWQYRGIASRAAAIFLVIFIPLAIFWFSPEGMARLRDIGGFETNPRVVLLHYFSYLSPQFLFFEGDPNLRHNPPGLGQLSLFEVITVPLGILLVAIANRKERPILLLWLLLYPIPAAFTEPSHAIRSIAGAPLFAVFSAYSLGSIADILKVRSQVYFAFVCGLVAASIAVLGQQYFIAYAKNEAGWWQYGMGEAITYADRSPYNCIKVSNQFRQAYILTLFYSQFPPDRFQRSGFKPAIDSEKSVGKFGKFEIGDPAQLVQSDRRECLYLVLPGEIDKIKGEGVSRNQISVVKDPNGNEAVSLIEVRR